MGVKPPAPGKRGPILPLHRPAHQQAGIQSPADPEATLFGARCCGAGVGGAVTMRQQGEDSSAVRRRPSSLGFVQMQNPEAVRSILADGAEQEIKGSMIRVQKFEHKAAASTYEEDSAEV